MEKAPYYTITWLDGDKPICQVRSGDEREASELAWRLKSMSWFGDAKPDRIRIARVSDGDVDLLDVLPLQGE